jgi:hypothetical protein
LPMVNFISEILSKDFEAIINLLLYVKECNKLILPLNTTVICILRWIFSLFLMGIYGIKPIC